ncbi:MAG TPA: glutathione S-transferase C-terminal domain-containing protein [Gammaproteobacteria bacterium]|nr:glutathione S-transferase C-terminal domain-containing protein [Gammaproteobacteria bacterium]
MIKRLVNGTWYPEITEDEIRRAAVAENRFSGRISADGSSGFPAAAGRYHLYVCYACPFAHRTLIARKLKNLEHIISISVLDPYWGRADGWTFSDCEGCTPDTANGFRFLHQVYTRANPDYTGRVTVPLLWDKKTGTAVNNESAEIIRMFNSEFNAFGDASIDLYPAQLRQEIDDINGFVQRYVNTGVYRAGFARTQEQYDQAVDELFQALDELELRLGHHPYLVGDQPTEADWRLFPTLVRFDVVYYGALKCNLRRLVDYPNLWRYTRSLYRVPGIADTVHLDHIKRHYYDHYTGIINRMIVPRGPLVEFA